MPSAIKKKLVVVDDEEYIGQIIAESLGDRDYTINVFTKPVEAIEFICNNPVDLVLSDILMGSYSGTEILETTLENHPDAITIMMTAHPTIQTAIAVLRRGAYDFLVKPFKLELLKATVKRGLAHQKVLRENMVLKSQVEFIKVTNSFFLGGVDLDEYFQIVLQSCNTELSARASAIIEFDPKSGDVIRQVHKAEHEEDVELVLDGRIDNDCGKGISKPCVKFFKIKSQDQNLWRVLISQPSVSGPPSNTSRANTGINIR